MTPPRVCRWIALPALVLLGSLVSSAGGQDAHRRGRKYKAPPDTSHLEIEVVREYNGKPVANAAVIFHPTRDGKDEGNLEVKTNEEGKAIIDVIPTGSNVGVQVFADGFATFAEEFLVKDATQEITIKMERPRAQISTYKEMHGVASQRPAGVQEPNHPSTPPVIQPTKPTGHTSDPNPLSPVSPNPTANQNSTPR